MTRGLIDGRLASRLGTRFYPDAMTVQTASVARGTAGSQVKTWTDDPTRTDIPCRVAPTGGGETERTDQVFTRFTHRIGLSSDWTVETGERVRVGATVFDVVLVETDSQSHATYLNVEVIE